MTEVFGADARSWLRRGMRPVTAFLPGRLRSPTAGRAVGFMIVGQMWRYPPQMTHDHGRAPSVYPRGYRGRLKPWPFNLTRPALLGSIAHLTWIEWVDCAFGRLVGW